MDATNDLNTIFQALKDLPSLYAPPLASKMDDASHYDLWSIKDLVIEGRKRKKVYFAGLIIQKGYVGFYFMPVYAESDMKAVFAPELLKRLKGKSCFHIKKHQSPKQTGASCLTSTPASTRPSRPVRPTPSTVRASTAAICASTGSPTWLTSTT